MHEEWRDVVGFEGFYQVSDLGRIKSYDRIVHIAANSRAPKGRSYFVKGRILKLGNMRRDGKSVVLSVGGVSFSVTVHRLVLTAFVGPRPEGMHGCHYDGRADNNRLSNLRWDTPANNCADKIRHGTYLKGSDLSWSVLKETDIPAIRERIRSGEKIKNIAADYKVTRSAIVLIKNGKTWAHVA